RGPTVTHTLSLHDALPISVYTGNGPVNIQDAASGSAPGAVIAYAVIAGTNNDGVRCRAAASYDAAVITVVPEGETVELTGDPVRSEEHTSELQSRENLVCR